MSGVNECVGGASTQLLRRVLPHHRPVSPRLPLWPAFQTSLVSQQVELDDIGRQIREARESEAEAKAIFEERK